MSIVKQIPTSKLVFNKPEEEVKREDQCIDCDKVIEEEDKMSFFDFSLCSSCQAKMFKEMEELEKEVTF